MVCDLLLLGMAPKIHNNSKFSKEQKKVCKLGCRWRTICISWKLVALVKFLKAQGFKSTFQKNLTCILLSPRANSKKAVCLDWPCSQKIFIIIFIYFFSNIWIWNISTFREFQKNVLMHRQLVIDRPWPGRHMKFFYAWSK